MGAADRAGACFGEAEEANLALGAKILDDAGDVLHRHVRVDAVLVVEIDVVGAEALQAALDGAADLLGAAVDVAAMRTGLLVDIPAELGRDQDLVAHAGKRFADHFLVGPRPIDFGGVEEIHAALDRRAQQLDHLRPVGNGARLAVAHGAKGQCADFEALAKFTLFHLFLLSSAVGSKAATSRSRASCRASPPWRRCQADRLWRPNRSRRPLRSRQRRTPRHSEGFASHLW